MFVLAIALLLAAIGVAVFPCWRHSARWGYTPSTVAGVLLVLVAFLVIGDRSLDSSQSPERRVAAQRAAASPVAAKAILEQIRSVEAGDVSSDEH